MAITVTCECGKQLRVKDEAAGKRAKCPGCGSFVTIPQPTIRPEHDEGQTAVAPSGGGGNARFLVTIIVLAVVGLAAGLFLVNSKIKSNQRDSANREVAQKVEAARAAVGQRKWDEAIELLQGAVTTKHATDIGEADRLLAEAKESKVKQEADQLLGSAEEAIRQHNLDEAVRLLREYQANPNATQKDRATRLLDGIELATSDERAIELLMRLSDADFRLFQGGGNPASLIRIDDVTLHEMALERLRGNISSVQNQRNDITSTVRDFANALVFNRLS